MNDFALLQKWRVERDAGAFKEIVRRHAGMVYATCERILRNAHDAEDIAQECFELLAAGRGNPKEHLAAWLHKAAVNRALNRLRGEKRRRTREADFPIARATTIPVEWNEIYRCVDEALDELPEKFRLPLIASFLENETNVAIARELGLSPSAVAYRIEKGIGLLRQSLRKKGVGVSLASLSALMTAHATPAAPESLNNTLGKLALAGPVSTSTVSSVSIMGVLLGGSFFVKKTIIGVGVLAVLGGLLFVQLSRMTDERRPRQVAQEGVAIPSEMPEPFVAMAAGGPANDAPETRIGFATPSAVMVQDETEFSPRSTFLHGKVLQRDGGAPVGAQVVLTGSFVQLQFDADGHETGGYSSRGGDTLEANIDESGYYRINELDPAQRYSIRVVGSNGQDLTPRTELGKLRTGSENRWDTELNPTIAVVVTVTGESSRRPIPKVTVFCAKIANDGSGEVSGNGRDITDGEGKCELVVTSGPGTYGLRVFYDDSGIVTTGPETRFHREIDLSDHDADIALTVPDRAVLRCFVVDSGGVPISGVLADTIVRRKDGITAQTVGAVATGTDGRLEVTVEPGTVIQCLLSHDGYSAARSLEYVFEPGAEWEETVVLYPSASLALSLVGPNNVTLANTSVVLRILLPGGLERTLDLKTDEYGGLLIENDAPATRMAIQVQAEVEVNGSTQVLAHRTGEFEVAPESWTELSTIRLEPIGP